MILKYKIKKFLAILVLVLLMGGNAYANAHGKRIKGDCINGQGTYTFASGDKYVGEFKDGEFVK